jgi:hypothetical protein
MTEKRNATEIEPTEKPTRDDEASREAEIGQLFQDYIDVLQEMLKRLRKPPIRKGLH